MRIFILSDHPLFGQGIERLINQQPGLQTVGHATDIQQALPQIQELRPDIIILESSNWPAGPAPTALPILAQQLDTRIIALNLDDNSLSIYRGERRMVKEVKDLLEAIEDIPVSPPAANTTMWATQARQRGEAYGLLRAVCGLLTDGQSITLVPMSELTDFFFRLVQLGSLPVDMSNDLDLIELSLHDWREKSAVVVLAELGTEYTRLWTHMEAADRPDDAAAQPSKEMREQANFVSLAFSALDHLCDQESQAWAAGSLRSALQILDKEQTILQEHVSPWIGRFCSVIVQETQLPFYKGLAGLTRKFLEVELTTINGLMTHAHSALGSESASA